MSKTWLQQAWPSCDWSLPHNANWMTISDPSQVYLEETWKLSKTYRQTTISTLNRRDTLWSWDPEYQLLVTAGTLSRVLASPKPNGLHPLAHFQ